MTRPLGTLILALLAGGVGALIGHRHHPPVQLAPPVHAVAASAPGTTVDPLVQVIAASDAALKVCELP